MRKFLLFILLINLLATIPQAFANEEYNILQQDHLSLAQALQETITKEESQEKDLILDSSADNKAKSEEDSDEETNDYQSEYSWMQEFDKNKEENPEQKTEKSKEKTLFARIMQRDIVRTDVPAFLLKDELTFKYEKGPINKIQFYGAYQGGLNLKWNDESYQNTLYDNYIVQYGMFGQLKDKKTDFQLAINATPAKGLTYMQNFIADAFIVNSRIPHHKIILGYSRNAVGFEGVASSFILPFVTRSQISRTFGSTRALGVKLMGDYPLVDYSFACNSSDRFFHEFFPGAEFTGWVNFKPLGLTDGRYGKLTIGGGINTGRNHTNYTVGGLYVGYKYKRLWSTFEYAIADGYNGSYISTKKAQGFYGTVGYKITPRVQLIARYDQFDPDRTISGNLRREITAGINWFLKGQALKFVLNFVYCMNQNAPNSARIIFATQILL